jgi:hypothetical protein
MRMAQGDKKRIGRPPKAAPPGKRVALGLKVTSEIKQRLDEEARKNGRTQSQQAELMIERAFQQEKAFGSGSVAPLAFLMTSSFAVAAGKSDWTTDPIAYGNGVAAVLDALLREFPNGADRTLALEGLVGRLLSRIKWEREETK